jgi:hypothetical protein
MGGAPGLLGGMIDWAARTKIDMSAVKSVNALPTKSITAVIVMPAERFMAMILR